MARFAGNIGFAHTVQVRPGVYKEEIVERQYFGDFTRKGHSLQEGEHLNDKIRMSNMVSVIADEYIYENASQIRYVNWAGTDWKISSVEVVRPRLVLYFGGVYNGSKA